jgi:hypothetical protein
MLQHVMVHGEGEGVAAYGKGGGGFYIDRGKTPVIRFVPERPGKYSFPCDLHQTMTGELKIFFNILNKRPPSCGPPDLPTSRNPSGQPSSRTSAWLSRASLGSTPNSGGAYGHLRGGAPLRTGPATGAGAMPSARWLHEGGSLNITVETPPFTHKLSTFSCESTL